MFEKDSCLKQTTEQGLCLNKILKTNYFEIRGSFLLKDSENF